MKEFDFVEEFNRSKAESPPKPAVKLWYIIVFVIIAAALGVTMNILAIWGVVVLLKSWGAL